MADADEERRSGRDRRVDDLDSRVLRLERLMASMDKTVAITEIRVQGLATTIESRFKAFDRGIELILETQRGLEAKITKNREDIDGKLSAYEALRNRAEGSIWVVRLLGIGTLITAVVAFFKYLKG